MSRVAARIRDLAYSLELEALAAAERDRTESAERFNEAATAWRVLADQIEEELAEALEAVS